MAIAVDASTPAVTTLANGSHAANLAVTCASFSPPAGSLIVITYNQEYSASGNTQPTLTPATTGTGLTWIAGPSQWQASLNGYTAAWAAFNASAQTGITVSVSASLLYTGGAQMRVRVYTGTASVAFGGGSATWSTTASTVENASITTKKGRSIVVAAAIGASGSVWTPTGGIATDGAVFVDSTAGNSCIVGDSTATPVTVPAATTMGWTLGGTAIVNGVVWEIFAAPEISVTTPSLENAVGSNIATIGQAIATASQW